MLVGILYGDVVDTVVVPVGMGEAPASNDSSYKNPGKKKKTENARDKFGETLGICDNKQG